MDALGIGRAGNPGSSAFVAPVDLALRALSTDVETQIAPQDDPVLPESDADGDSWADLRAFFDQATAEPDI